jgi:hypothetical protein
MIPMTTIQRSGAALLLLLLTAATYALAQTADITVLKADITKTHWRTFGGTPTTVIEAGSVYIAGDGRYRIDHLTAGERELINPLAATRTVINLARKEARTGSLAAFLAPPHAGRPVPPAVSGRPPVQDQVRTALGTRIVAGLTLEGIRHTTTVQTPNGPVVLVTDAWVYHQADPHLPPIILEQRLDGPGEIVEQSLQGAQQVRVAASIFDLPADVHIIP